MSNLSERVTAFRAGRRHRGGGVGPDLDGGDLAGIAYRLLPV
ncbi:hypothetical protein AB0M87_33225 [Streptomyces sp. NPDC051320]